MISSRAVLRVGFILLVAGFIAGCDQASDKPREDEQPMEIFDGHRMIFELNFDEKDTDHRKTTEAVVEMLKKRLDPQEISNLSIQPYGSDKVEIRMPANGKVSRSDVIRLVTKAGLLAFRVAPVRPELWTDKSKVGISQGDLEKLVKRLKTSGPGSYNAKFRWFEIEDNDNVKAFAGLITSKDKEGVSYVLLSNEKQHTMLSDPTDTNSWKLARANLSADSVGAPAVGFAFDDVGAKLFGNLTSGHLGESLTILIDGKAYSAPEIRAKISRNGIITGKFTVKEVRELVRILNAGALSAKINPTPVAEMRIGN